MRSLLVYFFILSLSFHTSFGQNIYPPSPDAAALGKAASTIVSAYSGMANVSIPIYTLQSRDITLPISLNYNTGGIRVDEEASWVGLGWTLNAGGVISQSIRGGIDDFTPTYGYVRTTNPLSVTCNKDGGEGTYIPYISSHFEPTPECPQQGWFGCNNQVIDGCRVCRNYTVNPKTGLLETDSRYDQEPDIFYFNFPGFSGRFVYDQDGIPYVLDQQKIKIQRVNSNFLVTATDGTKYEFNQKERTFLGKKSYLEILSSLNTSGEVIGNSWRLTKIISPLGEQVTFSYSLSGSADQTLYSERSIDDKGSTAGGTTCPQPVTKKDAQTITHEVYTLTDITFALGKVEFTSGTREDLTQSRKLDNIKVKRLDQSIVKQFDFTYSYFVSNDEALSSRYWDPLFPITTTYNNIWRRLKLDALVEKNGSTVLPPFQFTYNGQKLPAKTSFQKDHWGFYNGQKTNTGLIPPANDGVNPITPGANREPQELFAKACLLQQIKYPMGSVTKFDFELNDYQHTKNYYEFDTKKYRESYSVSLDQKRTTPSTLNFTVPSDGNTYTAKISFSFINNSTFAYYFSFYHCSVKLDGAIWQSNGTDLSKNIQTFTQAISSGSHTISVTLPAETFYEVFAGISVAIACDNNNINTKSLGGGLRVKSMTQLESPTANNPKIQTYSYGQGGVLMTPLNNLRYSQVTLSNNVSICKTLERYSGSNAPLSNSANGSPVGYTNVTVLEGGNGENGKTEFTFNNVPDVLVGDLPGMPTNIDVLNGTLTNQTVYAKVGAGYNKIKEVMNVYAKGGVEKVVYGNIYEVSPINSIYFATCKNIKIHVYKMKSEWPQLIKSTERTYNPTDPTKFIDRVKEFEYGAYNVSKITETNTDGTKRASSMYYANDYNSAIPFIKDMQTNFIFNKPIETMEYLLDAAGGNMQVLGGRISKYKLGGKGLVEETYAIESAIPITNFLYSKNTAGSSLVMDSRYKKTGTFYYDSYNNIIQKTKFVGTATDPSSSNIYGYTAGGVPTIPIAQISNATSSQVAYSSFENGNENGWEIGTTYETNLANVYSGKVSYRVAPGSPTFGPTKNITPIPQKGKYKISGWIKTAPGYNPAQGHAHLVIELQGGGYFQPITGISSSKFTYFEGIVDLDAARLASNTPAGTNLTLRCYVANYNSATSVYVDEMRIHPVDALMSTKTFDPLVGPLSETNASGLNISYSYDPLGRLEYVRDQDRNILKKYTYQTRP